MRHGKSLAGDKAYLQTPSRHPDLERSHARPLDDQLKAARALPTPAPGAKNKPTINVCGGGGHAVAVQLPGAIPSPVAMGNAKGGNSSLSRSLSLKVF